MMGARYLLLDTPTLPEFMIISVFKLSEKAQYIRITRNAYSIFFISVVSSLNPYVCVVLQDLLI